MATVERDLTTTPDYFRQWLLHELGKLLSADIERGKYSIRLQRPAEREGWIVVPALGVNNETNTTDLITRESHLEWAMRFKAVGLTPSRARIVAELRDERLVDVFGELLDRARADLGGESEPQPAPDAPKGEAAEQGNGSKDEAKRGNGSNRKKRPSLYMIETLPELSRFRLREWKENGNIPGIDYAMRQVGLRDKKQAKNYAARLFALWDSPTYKAEWRYDEEGMEFLEI